jgi:hypothetical protein
MMHAQLAHVAERHRRELIDFEVLS